MSPTMEGDSSEEVEFQFLDGNIIIQMMPRSLFEGKEFIVLAKDSLRPEYGNIKLYRRTSKIWGEHRPIFREERS